ncbi:dienelactone hydrolase family protein [Waterburya agarophytonicola K14]|uniref:Dienelactone hydrolase family protein n=1 Tax=Waterburya agarophytonicola KI4 TaxID=2874699 RepID=A0A964BRM7_9CYAN|nr:dienelactone hydrolase family protein [Waterburya agarophytonicola]MCC0177969.1 dienelactone hydrolase family protein [Waterburya agarophytonicola KI4]
MSPTIEAISAMPNGEKPTYLLVMLHGWGANYQDFVPFAKMLNFPGFGYFFPNAPFEHFQVPGGRAWYALEENEFTGLATSRKLLLNWLTSLEASTGVPLDRTVMAGFSQGGAMTLDVGLTLPLAAICSFSGYLHYQPEFQDNKTFPPTMIIHGQQDPVVPIEAAKKAQDELTKIGVSVQYQEFMMGHEVQDPAIALFKQFIQDNLNFN